MESVATNLVNNRSAQQSLKFKACICEWSQDFGKLLRLYIAIFGYVPQIYMRLNRHGKLLSTSIIIPFNPFYDNDLFTRAASVDDHWCVFSDNGNDLLVKMTAC